MVAQFYELTDSQWEIIKDFLPVQRKRKYDLRIIINAIFWIHRTGSQWRNLDSKYPNWQIVYYYFRSWTLNGTIEKMNTELNKIERRMWKKEDNPSLVCLDCQSVKIVPFTSQNSGIDGYKKVNGRKRHLVVDTLGLIIGVIVHAANLYDGPQGCRMIAKFKNKLNRVKKVIVDSAYRGQFVQTVRDVLNAQVAITSQNSKADGFEIIPKRWVVERTISWTNFFRRLATVS